MKLRIFINYALLLVLAVSTNSGIAQERLKFGLNMPYDKEAFVKMVTDTVNYSNFTKDYHIEYIRFPGGTVARHFIYNSSTLSKQAEAQISAYYQTAGGKGNKAQDNGKIYNFNFPDNYYEKFLEFCVTNKVQPLITLNTNYYSSNNKLYQIAPFKAQKKQAGKKNSDNFKIDLNDNLKKFITDQLNFTHRKIKKVTWEIGNEEYAIYDALTEAEIVNFYIGIIKPLYPQDEVIVSFANTFMGDHGNLDNKDKWNKLLVDKLNQFNLLQKINYFAPHFYLNAEDIDKSDEDIQKRIKSIDFAGYEKHHVAYFPKGYTPHFFYTEFAIYLGLPEINPNFNSNLHALMMFYFMMNFYASNYLEGVIYHSFLGKAPFVFIDPNPKAFNNNISNKTSSYNNIGVIPIQAQAIKIFYKNVGEKLVNFIQDGDLRILITQTGSKFFYFIINTSAKDLTIQKSKVLSAIQNNPELEIMNYYFEDLNSKNNVPNSQITKEYLNSFSAITVKKYSVLIIK